MQKARSQSTKSKREHRGQSMNTARPGVKNQNTNLKGHPHLKCKEKLEARVRNQEKQRA